jgi:hypothetical protein
MSVSNDGGIIAGLNRDAEAALNAVEDLAANDATGTVPDETAQRLLLAGVRLFACKVDREHRAIPPVPQSALLNATEVAVTVTELMRAADLNMFDLAMWSGRARPRESS